MCKIFFERQTPEYAIKQLFIALTMKCKEGMLDFEDMFSINSSFPLSIGMSTYCLFGAL